MTERYCEGERFADLSFTEEAFEDCDFTDCVFVDCSFTKCELDHTTLNECKFVRCEITGLRSTHSSVQSLDFEDCRLNEIEWAPLMSNGAFPDPIHTLKECSLKYNTFTEMNFNRFDFSDGNEIVGSMFAKCEMQLANFKGVELHETEFYQCDLRKADFRDAAGYRVDILGSRLKDAKFSLPEAVNLLADLKIKLSSEGEKMRQLIIARKDLQMSPGKLAAQCCHASLAFLTDPIGMGQGVEPIEKDGEITGYRAEIMLEKATYEEWFDGSFTKTICGAKNRNQLLKAKTIAEELGLVENKDFFLIRDACHTELEPEEFDENGEGMTLTCIGFRPLPDEIAHQISHKFHLY